MQARLDPDRARELVETLHRMRTKGGEHRALREHIANRIRVRKRAAQELYERFDRGWHAGVDASLGKHPPQPPLEADPLGHFAFEAARGRTERLIAERTAQPVASRRFERYLLGRSALVAAVVVALTGWLSEAAGWKLAAVLIAAGSMAFLISIQMATVIENCVMIGIVVVVALVVAWAGFGEVFWPSVCGALAGAVNGIAQRAAWERRSGESAEPPG